MECGVSKTMKILGSKWTGMILYYLLDGTRRFGELERFLVGISPKTLALRLQELESEGIVVKKVFAEVPLHVEYSLTEKGKSLSDIFRHMELWDKQH